MEWDKLKSAYNEKNLHKSDKINVTLPDGEILCAYSWRITPLDIAKDISRSLAKQVVMAIVDSQSWDMERPLEASCHLRLLKLNDRMAKDCYLDSTAHILGAALERLYGGHLCDHSSLESQFCFEIYLPDKDISSSDFPTIENTMYTIVGEEQLFERLHLSKEDVLRLFEDDEFKKQKVLEKVSTPTVTVYRCGSFIDLCEGPHVQHTGKIKAFKITERKVTSWKGDSSKQLLKVCGVSFENKKMWNEWEKQQDDIAKRDHRVIGRNQELFFFHEMSPGSPFFLPNGTHIYNKLIDFIEAEYRKRGYTNVITPNIFKSKLWEISGHWDHYHSNMFTFDVDEEKFALKPMNCPGHCLMYGFRPRSWRELPLRLADFGVLHRKEYSGGLSGLTRLYRFQQDDAHIFCAVNQIKSEIMAALEFLKHIYEVLGFELQLFLSTRPETFMGQSVLWDHAEKQLIESLNEFGMPWKENPGDGAFYGPKIDIIITDFLQRSHQCATIQLDFQLPIRFNLYYKSKKREMARPVIIHRAILGSVERMVAILAESYAGKWPFWLSPRQAIVLTITPAFEKYAANVHQQLFDAGFATSLDCNSSDTINKKIRNAQLDQFNFILVVGPREINTGTVNVRTRNNVVQGEFTVEEIIKKFHYLTEAKGSKDDCDMKHI